MDLTKLSDNDLLALSKGDMQALSDEGLSLLAGATQKKDNIEGLLHQGKNLLAGIDVGVRSLADMAVTAPNMLAGGLLSKLGEATGSESIRGAGEDFFRRMEQTQQAIHEGEIQPETLTGKVAAGLVPIAATLPAGGAGVGTLLPSAFGKTGQSLVQQGVDANTASQVAGIDTAGMLAGALVPGGRLIQAGANVGTGAASDFAAQQLLKARGFEQAAEQYDPLNVEHRLVDLAAGAMVSPNRPKTKAESFADRAKQFEPTAEEPLKVDIVTDTFKPEVAPGKYKKNEAEIPYAEFGQGSFAENPRAKSLQEDVAWEQRAAEQEPAISKEEAFSRMEKTKAEEEAAWKEREQLLEDYATEPNQPKQSSRNHEQELLDILNETPQMFSGFDLKTALEQFNNLSKQLDDLGLNLELVKGLPTTIYHPEERMMRDLTHDGKPGLVTAVVRNDQGKIVGFADMVEHRTKPGTMEIAMVKVDPEYRRQGVATEMMNALKDAGFEITPSDLTTDAGKAFQKAALGAESSGTLGGVGKRGFGQGGSIGFHVKEQEQNAYKAYKGNYNKFLNDMRDSGVSDQAAKKLWDQDAQVALGAAKQKAAKKLPGMEQFANQYDPIDVNKPIPELVKDIESNPIDLKDMPSTATKQLTSRGLLHGWAIDNPVVNKINTVANKIIERYQQTAEESLYGPRGVNKMLTKMEGLLGRGLSGDVLLWRMANEGKDVKPTHFTKEQLDIYNRIDEVRGQLLDKINNVLVNRGRKVISDVPNYIPSLRKGEFFINFTRNDGTLAVRLPFTNKYWAEAVKRYIEANPIDGLSLSDVEHKPRLASQKTQYKTGQVDAGNIEFLSDLLSSDDPMVQQAMNAVDAAHRKAAMDALQFKQRFKHKAFIGGAEGRRPGESKNSNYYAAKDALTNYIESANQWLAGQEIADFMKGINESKTLLEKAPKALDYSNELVNSMVVGKKADNLVGNFITGTIRNITGFDKSAQKKLAGKYASLETFRLLAMRPQMFIQTFIQPFRQSMIRSAEMLDYGIMKSPIQQAVSLLQMVPDFTAGLVRMTGHEMFGKEVNVPFTDQKLLDHAEAAGFISPTVLEASGIGKRKLATIGWKSTSGISMRYPEQASRYAFFANSFRNLEAAGFPEAQALRIAENWTSEYMVNYNPQAKARIFSETGMMGDIAGRIQTYKMNTITQYLKTLKEASTKGNYAQAVAMFGTGIMLGGLYGMIGMDVMEEAWDIIKKIDRSFGLPTKDIQDFSPKRYAIEHASDFFTFGALSSATNTGLFSSFAEQTVGEGSLGDIAPVLSSLPEKVNAAATLLGSKTDMSNRNNFEKANMLKAFAPTVAGSAIERNLLTDEQGRVFSPKSGTAVYQKSPEMDAGLMTGKMSMRSLPQAKESILGMTYQKSNQDINESKTKVFDAIKSEVSASIVEQKQPDKEKLKRLFNKFVEFEGDPQSASQQLEQWLVQSRIPGQMRRDIMKETTLGNVGKQKRAITFMRDR